MTDLPDDWPFSHDRFFKRAMSYPQVAQEFFSRHLPQALQSRMDLETIQLHNTSFIDKKLQHQCTDLLFSVNIDNKPAYIYLLAEHQSTSDYWLPFRVHKYQVGIMDHHRVQYPKANELPIIITLVLYNGSEPYNQPTHIRDLFNDPQLGETYHTSQFILVDLNTISDEPLRQSYWSGTMEFMLKYARMRNALSLFNQIQTWLPKLEDAGAYDYIELIICYNIANSHNNDEVDELIEQYKRQLSPKGGKTIMNGLEYLMQKDKNWWINQGIDLGKKEGKEEGIESGIKHVAHRMLKKGMHINEVHEITKLPLQVLRKLNSSGVD